MCYFLYGGINEDANLGDLEKLKGLYHFQPATATAFEIGVNNNNSQFYLNSDVYCDCGTPIGLHHPNKKGIKEYADGIKALRDVRSIKYIYIAKSWRENKIKSRQTVHIDDIDLPYFLAEVENDCLYEIQMFCKYY